MELEEGVVEWVNERAETGLPYDLTVRYSVRASWLVGLLVGRP